MISVVIPVYNVSQYLSQCIDSVLNQTYTDWELILIDDGSSDGSGSICDSYSKLDSRIRVIHQANSGVSASRNKGIECAKGEWITFIDSDDFVDKNYLFKFDCESNNSDIVLQGLEYYDNRTNQFFKQVNFNNTVLTEQNIKQEVEQKNLLNIGYPSAKAIRMDLINNNRIRFDTSISLHEDHIFVLQLFSASKSITLSDGVGYKYRCYHSVNSLSSKRHPWRNRLKASNQMICLLSDFQGRFFDTGSAYHRRILSVFWGIKFLSLFDMLCSADSFENKKKHFLSDFNRVEFKHYYHPSSIRYKLLRILVVYFPFEVTYSLIRLYYGIIR